MRHLTAYIQLNSNGEEKPLMLQELLFCPVVRWVCDELVRAGVQRFYVACDERWAEEARLALADLESAEVVTAVPQLTGTVLVLPEAVVPVEAYGAATTYTVEAEELLAHLAAGKAATQRPAGAKDSVSFLPVRSLQELRRAMPLGREAIIARHAENGVYVMDAANTYIDPRCRIGAGVTILPGTILRGNTSIGAGCEIGPNTMIRDCTIGENTTVNASQLNESTVGSRTTVGPFAYIRPHCTIGDKCRVGDFVEVKNSVIANGTKIYHLTYVGDSDVGERVNFGCGTVTTNYDGHRKFRCTIGDDVFLGCNTNLVAPVTVGEGAYTAAGSTVTGDVPAGALAVARARQENKDGWAVRFRESWTKDKK